jgi:hypothetical protein
MSSGKQFGNAAAKNKGLAAFAPSAPTRACPSIPSAHALIEEVNASFRSGEPNQFAQGHLLIVIPGDFNQDGVVDAADYVVWRKNDGTPDGNNTWRAHFGGTVGGAGATDAAKAAVPEPTSLVILFLAAAIGLRQLPRRASV